MKTSLPLLTITRERQALAAPSLAGLFAIECGAAPRAIALANRAWTMGTADYAMHGAQFGGTVNTGNNAGNIARNIAVSTTVILASKSIGSDQKYSIRRFTPLVANG